MTHAPNRFCGFCLQALEKKSSLGYNETKRMVSMDRVLLSRIENAINEFCRLLRERLGRNLVDIRLFGSVARGTFTAESDIDILVVLHDEDRLSRETVIEAAVDINLEYNVVISPVIMSMRHYSCPMFREAPFYGSIQGEGVPLSLSGTSHEEGSSGG